MVLSGSGTSGGPNSNDYTASTRSDSSPHRKLKKPRPITESRTMALARQMAGSEPQGTTTLASPYTKSWNYAISYVGRKVSREKSMQLNSTTVVAKATSASSQVIGPTPVATQPYAIAIYDYFRHPAHAMLHPVSAFEHYWALRAARAEVLLSTHVAHKQELDNVSAAHEERRSREIADLNAKYDREYAHIRRMVWTIVVVAAFAIAMCSYLILRYIPPTSSTSGRHSAMHFTIPILSPFTSVIEHETSAVNVQLVAVLLLAAAIFGTIWLKCCTGRR
ncbi:hypothetical protein LXA43DRAFT_75502 [Ganoderma leucocontextum]|nr:hypothetical protein LXA43DRAFT_75502 [Ganoderma leucocontextum]